ncbi:cation diffusion facilitator family transporter [Brasilonema octagenarum]|uniref:Cation transporter n=1 Tax=Brasilonema octagenarum UFV-OR1 TaxID=417115 RepID=A0ABX1MCS5_9CYAN|nr:cation diffusion facilitator family transporter [Brasilonema octagenarum]NMF64841.1 cation transporter [Brasilonema octagenarum UFV-OR1]
MLSVKQHLNWFEIGFARSCTCCKLDIGETNQPQKKIWRLWLVVALLISVLPAEIGIGLWSHSLSLQADAGHLISDIGALGLTLLASWLAGRPAASRATFGHGRVEILAALINGVGLVAIAGFIAWETFERFQHPEPVLSLPLLLGAGLGLIVNSLNLTLLHKHSLNDLNLRAAFLHIVADAFSSVGILVAAVVIYCLKWWWIDPIISLLIACFAGLSAIPLIWSSLEILLEYAPRSINPTRVEAALQRFAAVRRVEMLRIWEIRSGQIALCAHLCIDPLDAQKRDHLQWELQTHLIQAFGIHESTLQLSSQSVTNLVPLHPLLNRSLVSYIHKQSTKITS